jgi:DNA uptake protein ComE-like DNA-binding protein
VAQRARSPFRKPEDVLAVKGLGPKWFARVKGNVTIGAPSAAAQPRR